MGMGMMGWGVAVWMVLGGLIALAVLVTVVLGAVWLARELRGRGTATTSGPTPREVLERRYAAGEIDDEELHRRQRT